jgi:integrase
VLAGLRRCEVLGLRFEDVRVADRRLAVVAGNGGHHLVVPAANRFFGSLGAYLHDERPAAAGTDRVFVVLKAPGAACRCRRRGWMRSWTAPGSASRMRSYASGPARSPGAGSARSIAGHPSVCVVMTKAAPRAP